MENRRERKREIFPKDPNKTYGMMELVKGKSLMASKEPEDTVMTYPHLLSRVLICSLLVIIFLLLLSFFFNAPLKEKANPAHPENPAKAPWYFLGIQEIVSHSAFIGGVIFPFIFLVGLILIPYLDRKPRGVGRWFAKERKIPLIIFSVWILLGVVFTLIGGYLRGENWKWVWPWR